MKTTPFRILDQATMDRVLAVADAAGLSREAIRVPLAGEGEGSIARGSDGVWTVVLPASGDLDGFLARLGDLLRAGAAG
jgi:hypothetical protein